MTNLIVWHCRLVRDPELRRTQAGVVVVNASVACDRDMKNDDGSHETDFIDVVAWRRLGEFFAKYFKKGQEALVTGRLETKSYVDSNGIKRHKAEIVAEKIEFCGSKKESSDKETSKANNSSVPHGYSQNILGEPANQYGDFAPLEGDDYSLPF